MSSLLLPVEQFLRTENDFTTDPSSFVNHRRSVNAQIAMILAGGFLYGMFMGSFNGLAGDRWNQILMSGLKVPMLYFVTFLLCLPSFFVINALTGLRDDFPRVLGALLAFQAEAAIVLASLAPITLFMNLSTAHYSFVVLWNGVIFAFASVLGHSRLRLHYLPLIFRDTRHRVMLRVWIVLYVFVAIQMAWVLRPFIGDPKRPVQLFRPQAWGNAYVQVIELIGRVIVR